MNLVGDPSTNWLSIGSDAHYLCQINIGRGGTEIEIFGVKSMELEATLDVCDPDFFNILDRHLERLKPERTSRIVKDA